MLRARPPSCRNSLRSLRADRRRLAGIPAVGLPATSPISVESSYRRRPRMGPIQHQVHRICDSAGLGGRLRAETRLFCPHQDETALRPISPLPGRGIRAGQEWLPERFAEVAIAIAHGGPGWISSAPPRTPSAARRSRARWRKLPGSIANDLDELWRLANARGYSERHRNMQLRHAPASSRRDPPAQPLLPTVAAERTRIAQSGECDPVSGRCPSDFRC